MTRPNRIREVNIESITDPVEKITLFEKEIMSNKYAVDKVIKYMKFSKREFTDEQYHNYLLSVYCFRAGRSYPYRRTCRKPELFNLPIKKYQMLPNGHVCVLHHKFESDATVTRMARKLMDIYEAQMEETGTYDDSFNDNGEFDFDIATEDEFYPFEPSPRNEEPEYIKQMFEGTSRPPKRRMVLWDKTKY